MALTEAGKALALGPLSATTMSLHTGDAGDTGAENEATGGGYARKACTLAAASAGARALINDPLFDVPAGTFPNYGLWIDDVCIEAGLLGSPKVLNEAGQVIITDGDINLNSIDT
tara:strand:- start:161202 stop:161546 length:345 start_codon:yes stop_codon:yes gene_type:complete